MNQLIKLVDGVPTLTVSVSQLEAMKQCGQLYEWRYVQRRELDRAEGARDAGKAFDCALNAYYSLEQNNITSSAIKAEAANSELEAAWPKALPEDEWRTLARYKDLLGKCLEHWKEEPFVTEGVQVKFDVPLGSVVVNRAWALGLGLSEHYLDTVWDSSKLHIQVRLHGLMDRRVRFTDSGRVAILDTKVKGKWEERRVSVDMQRNGQAAAYLYADNQLHPEDKATTFILDAVICREPYKTEAGAKANRVPREEFHRPSFTLLPEVVENWRVNALRWCEDMLRQMAAGEWRENESHCAWHYGGTCPYKDVCNMPTREQRLRVLGSDLYKDYTSPFDTANDSEENQ